MVWRSAKSRQSAETRGQGRGIAKVMYRLIEAEPLHQQENPRGGRGDSAIEAAWGSGTRFGNQVTLSYPRKPSPRIKERNAQRHSGIRPQGQGKLILTPLPGVQRNSVVLEVDEQEPGKSPTTSYGSLPVGEPPTAFLKKIGMGWVCKTSHHWQQKKRKSAKGGRVLR